MAQRGKKPSMPQFPGDFIALGAKSGSSGATKRDAVQAGAPSSSLGKPKPKVLRPSPPSSASSTQSLSMPSFQDNAWESMAIDCDPTELRMQVEEAEAQDNSDRVEGLLLGGVKNLKNQRAKPDPVLYLTLMYLSKSRDYLYLTKDIIEAFCSLLKRDVKEAYKSKGNALVSVLSANVLMSALRHERQWPEILVKVYIEDAIGERIWVDHPDCKGFVENICTAFDTKMPTTNIFFATGTGGTKTPVGENIPGRESPGPQGSGSRSGSGSATPTRAGTDDDSQNFPGLSESLPINVINIGDPMSAATSPNPALESVHVQPRFEGILDRIEHLVVEVVREQFNRRQGTDNITRNFIKFLTTACGLMEIRHLVVPKLEMWIMNPKISRPAQDLLMAVAMNCNSHSPQDIEVIHGFTKFRFKNKPNINLYLSCVRELCAAHKENMPTLLKYTVFNELSNARNTNNMAILQVMFNYDKELAPASLAGVYIELLMQKECYLRALRALLREIVRYLRYDINLHAFCLNLMQLPPAKELMIRDFEFKERIFSSMTDLITLAIFLGISPHVKEGMTALIRGDDKKDITPFRNFLKQTAMIQRDAMVWMLESALKTYKPEPAIFTQSFHKVLFMVPSEEYWRIDGWPDEASRNLYVKATSEIPLLQDTLSHIFVIGISKQHPINGRDIIDLAECLVKRAAGLHPLIAEDFQVLHVGRFQQVMEFLFQLAAYNYPDSITLPKDYQPPKMAISSAYWKAWQILVILCAHNPSDFGGVAWEQYPTLRAMMEMCITNQFQFPPPTLASGEQAEEIRSKEVQTSTLEKGDILQFEIHLAAATNKATITESNSLLLAQLITNDPEGSFRRPPQSVLDQLAQANQHYKIGHLLCRSRSPDFLLDILQRQGSNQAMPWLADLVESSEGSFNVLPVQCLCEFLLNSTTAASEENASEESQKLKKRKQKQLLVHLQNLLQHPMSEEQQRSSIETLDYFMRRLGSQQTHQRLQALKGLQLVLSPMDTEEDEEVQVVNGSDLSANSEWLLKRLPRLSCFANYYPQISNALRFACQVENDPLVVSIYIQFLAHYAPDSGQDLADLCLDISINIIVERSTLLPAILPGTLCKTPAKVANDTYASLLRLFVFFMSRVRRRADQPQSMHWRENDAQELILVQWPHEQVTATIHFFIVHAQIILLTYGPQQVISREGDLFGQLLSIWNPRGGKMPKACMMDGREADLIPDWLKLKMIRSEVTPLVDAALIELDPTKLVLFIQSFGIPVPSMSKLLQALDVAIQRNYEAVNKAVMDKTYMGQLVGVQHQRGATGGQIFAEMLGLNLSANKEKQENVRLEPPRPSMMATKRPDIIIPPRSTAMIPPGAVKSTLFQLFDVGSPSRMTLKEKRDTFRTLQKYLTSEIGSNLPTRPMLDATVRALEAILIKEKELKEAFVTSMLQHPSFSASLIRLLTCALLRPNLEDLPAAQVMTQVAASFLNDNSKKRVTVFKTSPLWKLLEDFLAKRAKKNVVTKPKENTFETEIKAQVDSALKRKNTKPLVESMANMLLNDSKSTKQKGTIIDWLQKIDPELKELKIGLRQKVLFNKNPHLLTVFSHLSNWSHLKETIDGILKKETMKEYEAKAVLDFLSTCVFLKMQWQCNDKHKPKHDSGPQDVLKLSMHQVEVILEFIINEAKNEDERGLQIIKSRVPLIVSCLNTPQKATQAMNFLQTMKSNESIVKDLILQIYMKLPQSLLNSNLQNCNINDTSQVDTISHFLLSALASTQHGRSWTDQMKEFEAAARKLASTHPLLLLRNLPLLAAGMKGRTDFDFSFFRSRNHMTFYSMALGLLELTTPLIFEEKFKNSLQDCLECYMTMFKNYYARREAFSGMIDKVVGFLHLYLNHAPQEAGKFIKGHRKLLAMYNKVLTNSPALTEMAKIVKLEEEDCEDTEECSVVISGSSNFLSSEKTRIQDNARKLASNLQSALQDESELIEVLGVIKVCSNSQPAILPYFQEDFCNFISHESKIVRNHAYELYVKLLRFDPKLSQQLIVPFIGCLESNDASIARHAMEKLPDVAPLAQEHLEIILNTAFNLGLYSNLEVVNPICDTLSLMNGLAGY